MNDEKLFEILMEIKADVSKISATQSSLSEILKNHENRIMSLEGIVNSNKGDADFKVELLKLLAKGLLIGMIVIGSLTGAGSLIKQIYFNTPIVQQENAK